MSELPKDIDPECRPLCLALNKIEGIKTLESCCGHGRGTFRIFFFAQGMDALYGVTCLIDDPQWQITVCGGYGFSGKTAYFMLESLGVEGERAYEASYRLAKDIEEEIKKSPLPTS